MRNGNGRRDAVGTAAGIVFADPIDRTDSWLALAGAAFMPKAAGAALPATIQPDAPEPGDSGAPTHIIGTTGDDVLTGTALADLIEDGWGDDVIDGGDGNDRIADGGGSNVVTGGGGDDIIRLYDIAYGTSAFVDLVRTNSIDAGDGDDEVRIELGSHQRLTIDLGAGNDLLTFSPRGVFDNQIQVTTGAGADRIVLDRTYGDALRVFATTLVVTDFTAGAGGDVLDIGGLLKGLLAFTSVAPNPFSDHHLRLVQDGADTIVRVDVDGDGPGTGDVYIRDIARLVNVSAAALTSYNLAGYSPTGSSLLHVDVNGTNSGEWLQGSNASSDIFGLDGDDRITGGVGNDRLEGGAGNDTIDGGLGSDLLRGGDGDDILTDSFGNDIFEGGAGNDIIAVVRPVISSALPFLFETISIDAGDGDDFVSFEIQSGGFFDVGTSAGRGAALTIDLGAGNDRVELPYIVPDAHLTLGAGQDRVVLGQLYLAERASGDVAAMAPLVITDFLAGNGGDVLEVDRAILVSTGWNGVTNPFTAGYLLLQQTGADTLVLWDYDGSGPQTHDLTIARLNGVNAASLTAFNFGGYAPDGSASSYTVMNGTAGADHLYGSSGSDVIDGGGGNDIIEDRKNGSDTLLGGDGDDAIIVDHYSPVIPETVTIDAGTGDDDVSVFGNYHQLNLNLGTGDDRLNFRASGENGTFITLGAGADVMVIDQMQAVSEQGPITITDFATGNNGDRLDWNLFAETELLNTPLTYQNSLFDLAAYNPFLTDDARLVQSGADTLLQINSQAGTIFPASYVTVVTFQNTNAASFTAYNIGYDTYAPTQTGTSGDDTLTGTGGMDVLVGNGGDDRLDGLAGDDILRGHDGADVLTGVAGLDRLEGGKGEDSLSGGDDGDWLDGGSGRDVVDGGDGDDTIVDLFGADAVSGGAGDDNINMWGYFDANGTTGAPPPSIDAGDGNDIVNVNNQGVVDHLSVSLGAGDDIIHIVRPIESLSLGAGRDTIFYGQPNRLSGTLVVSDFTPGDGGDIIDLHTLLSGPLTGSQALILVEQLGFDPFALGAVELRQHGSDVDLYIYPDGTNDDAIYGNIPSIRLLNVNVAQLTAANFAGQGDPHATPNRATVIEHDLTVGAGQTLDALNAAPLRIFLTEYYSTHFTFRNLSGPANFVNHGTITTRLTALGFGGLAGIVVNNGMTSGGSFVNAADGHFIVDSSAADPTIDISSGETYGFLATSLSVLFRNDGDFQVHAAAGVATGVLAGYDLNNQPVINNGTFVVTSNYDAYGFVIGQFTTFTNTGTVTVSGHDFALGVWLRDSRDGEFYNSGSITAITGSKSAFLSVGVLVYHDLAATQNYYNTGSITADIAFYSDDGNTQFSGNRDVLLNSGQIHGAILMGASQDSVINTGLISGAVSLGDGNDLYDGRGGTLDGYVLGEAGSDILYGGAGNDDLEGGGDGDLLNGGGGADILAGGAGNDRFVYMHASDSSASAPDRIVDFETGIDKIDLSSMVFNAVSWAQHVDPSDGSSYNLVEIQTPDGVMAIRLDGTGLANSDFLGVPVEPDKFVTGTDGDDVLNGGAGNDTLVGKGGNDMLDGRAGADFMDGGAGNDSFHVDTAGDYIIEAANGGSDRVYASADYTLYTGQSVETLSTDNDAGTAPIALGGNELANFIYGNAGNNTLYGKGGDDFLIGLGGNDSYYVDSAGDYVQEAPGGGFDRIYASADYTLFTGQSIEILATDNNAGTAPIALGGNELDNIIYGNAGDNILYGKGGNDFLGGLGGNDSYFVDSAGDYVQEFAGGGSDRIYASADYTLYTGQSIEILSTDNNFGTAPIALGGNELDNIIYGNAGDNVLYGKGGNDFLGGLAGNDSYFVDSAGDYVQEAAGGGNDRIYASGDYTLYTGQSIEILSTDNNAGTASIALGGNELDNIIFGNDGNNILYGKEGNDTLLGGGGSDQYWFNTALGATNVDTIYGFASGSDRLVLFSSIFAGLSPGGLSASAFVVGSAAGDADDRIIYNSATGALLYDDDGNGAHAAVQFATLSGAPAITTSDIVVF